MIYLLSIGKLLQLTHLKREGEIDELVALILKEHHLVQMSSRWDYIGERVKREFNRLDTSYMGSLIEINISLPINEMGFTRRKANLAIYSKISTRFSTWIPPFYSTTQQVGKLSSRGTDRSRDNALAKSISNFSSNTTVTAEECPKSLR